MMSARAGKRSRGDTNPSPVSIVEYNYASVESKIDASKHTQLVKALLRTDIFDSESILVNFPNKQESDLRTPPPSAIKNGGCQTQVYIITMLGRITAIKHSCNDKSRCGKAIIPMTFIDFNRLYKNSTSESPLFGSNFMILLKFSGMQ
mmetsp:Transcript_25829/g.38287  ORF Transcript_25829/g.38287 Transcript_25829/m.38287 type:complete len:148 (-) Transcript_25829:433-876(-)